MSRRAGREEDDAKKKKKPSNSNAAERKTVPSNFAPTGAGLETKLDARPWLTPIRTQLGRPRRRWKRIFFLVKSGRDCRAGRTAALFHNSPTALSAAAVFSPPRPIGPQRCPACEPVNPESEGDEECVGGGQTNMEIGEWKDFVSVAGSGPSRQTDV